MDVHTYILPMDLLFCKLLFCAALCLCTLPTAHLLCRLIRSAACQKVKCYCLPIHHLINFVRLNPSKVKTIFPVRRSPSYNPAFEIIIPPSREAALPFAILTNTTALVHIYTDGSWFKNGIGALALLYINEAHSLRSGGVGLIMGFHLLNGLSRQLTHPTVLETDSQAVIRSLNNQKVHSGQYLLNAIHQAAK